MTALATEQKTQLAPFQIKPITFEETAELLTSIASECMELTVESIEDKEGIAAVHKSRMQIVKLRGNIEKERKTMKADALEYGKQVDNAAKALVAIIAPAEAHLEHEESVVEREKERIRKQEEAKRQSILRSRLEALAACGFVCLPSDIEFILDDEYNALLAEKQAEKKARDEAVAREAEERARMVEQQRIEAERLSAERAEFEATAKAERDRLAQQQREQAEAQAKIDAENKRIADAEAAREFAAELEKAKQEAAEIARREAEQKRKRDEAEATARAEAEEAERKRVEALRPDNIKLLSVAELVDAVIVPEVSRSADAVADEIRSILRQAAAGIRAQANSLVAKKRR
jgi:hypothetical protein